MTVVCQRHEFIRQSKIQMRRIKVIIIVFCIIPCAVYLIPFAIQLHGIPGMSIIGIPCLSICYAGCSKQFRIGALICLTCAQLSCQCTLRRRPFQGMIVIKLLQQPVMQPQCLFIVRTISLLAALFYRSIHDVTHARISLVRYLYICAHTHIIDT